MPRLAVAVEEVAWSTSERGRRRRIHRASVPASSTDRVGAARRSATVATRWHGASRPPARAAARTVAVAVAAARHRRRGRGRRDRRLADRTQRGDLDEVGVADRADATEAAGPTLPDDATVTVPDTDAVDDHTGHRALSPTTVPVTEPAEESALTRRVGPEDIVVTDAARPRCRHRPDARCPPPRPPAPNPCRRWRRPRRRHRVPPDPARRPIADPDPAPSSASRSSCPDLAAFAEHRRTRRSSSTASSPSCSATPRHDVASPTPVLHAVRASSPSTAASTLAGRWELDGRAAHRRPDRPPVSRPPASATASTTTVRRWRTARTSSSPPSTGRRALGRRHVRRRRRPHRPAVRCNNGDEDVCAVLISPSTADYYEAFRSDVDPGDVRHDPDRRRAPGRPSARLRRRRGGRVQLRPVTDPGPGPRR